MFGSQSDSDLNWKVVNNMPHFDSRHVLNTVHRHGLFIHLNIQFMQQRSLCKLFANKFIQI